LKALIMGDVHFRLNNPISRKDNIQEAFEDKFNQIKSIIKESDIHYIITTGDIFDKQKLQMKRYGLHTIYSQAWKYQ